MLLNLLIMCLTLINLGGKIEEKHVDLDYVDIALNQRRAFSDDTYTSLVNGFEAHRYYSGSYETTFTTTDGFYGYYFDLNYNRFGYNFLPNSNLTSQATMSQALAFATSFQEYSDNWLIVTCNAGFQGQYGYLVRFYYAENSLPQNIEFSFSGTNLKGEVYFSEGSYSAANLQANKYQSISIANWFLLNDHQSLTSTTDFALTPQYVHTRFYSYFFFIPMESGQSGYLTTTFNALGSFDTDYQDAYDLGYSNGQTDASRDSYQQGYSDAIRNYSSMDTTAVTIFSGILEVGLLPINVFLSIFNFEVFGINISGIVSGLLTIAILIIVLRFLFGGKSNDK